MGELAAKPIATSQLAVQRPANNIISLEPGRFSVQKARMNNQLREFLS